jgi:hypothetical protein
MFILVTFIGKIEKKLMIRIHYIFVITVASLAQATELSRTVLNRP